MWIESSDFPVAFQIPAAWVLDRSYEKEGVITAVAPRGLSAKFSANVVAVAERRRGLALQGPGMSGILDEEREKEPQFLRDIEEYRLIFLGKSSLGEEPSVKRLAFHYKNDLPITFQQYIAPYGAATVSITFSYPAMEAPLWQPRIESSMAEAVWIGE